MNALVWNEWVREHGRNVIAILIMAIGALDYFRTF